MSRFNVNHLLVLFLLATACSQTPGRDSSSSARAPVSITHVRRDGIGDSVQLTATTFYRSRNRMSAPVSGYVTQVNSQTGDRVKRGEVLFEIRTREANALQDAPDMRRDTSLSRLGMINVKAPVDGFITSVEHLKGDFVQQGGPLGRMVSPGELCLKLSVPYEYRSAVEKVAQLDAQLPSGELIPVQVEGALNSTDPVSQSVNWLLKPNAPRMLPEGLKLSVNVPTVRHPHAQLLPKEAVLADETLQHYWVMQVVGDTLAVKVPVAIGLENEQQVEIRKPHFSPSDRIIKSGQFGLEDSTLVHIIQPGS